MLVTNKQPSSNPRLVKEATALYKAGYQVTVVYNYWSSWAEEADRHILDRYPRIGWIKSGSNPATSKYTYWFTRLRHKVYRILADKFPTVLSLQENAGSQFFPELKRKACGIKADLYIAHNAGALPVAAAAAKKNGVKYAFDAEDFHRSQEAGNSKEFNAIKLIEDRYLPDAAFITAGSELIGAEYQKNYPLKKITAINNVFSKSQQPVFHELETEPLKIFWFSQTVGLKRGVQDVIGALNSFSDFPVSFTILGDTSASVKKELQEMFGNDHHTLHFLPPCNESQLIETASRQHIGLALEPGFSLNNNIALSNKLFTYLLSGCAVILTATPAQQLFYSRYPQCGWCYTPGDIATLVSILREAHQNQATLLQKRKAAWQLAASTCNWETEQQEFLTLVKQAV